MTDFERVIAARVTIDGKTWELALAGGLWQAVLTAPIYRGDYPVTITLDTVDDKTFTYNTTAPVIGSRLILQVRRDGRPVWLINYLPPFLREIREYQEICLPEELELERLYDLISEIYPEACFLDMGESRLKEWEQALAIMPQGTLEQRRTFILATLRGQGKLSGEKIRQIVRTFTNNDALVDFKDSRLHVRVLRSKSETPIRFEDIERAIRPRLPAHIGLSVELYQSTWQDILDDLDTWQAVLDQLPTWQDVLDYVPRRELEPS